METREVFLKILCMLMIFMVGMMVGAFVFDEAPSGLFLYTEVLAMIALLWLSVTTILRRPDPADPPGAAHIHE